MSDTHRCPYEGCQRRLSRDLFACSSHWFKLPEKVRDDVWRAYRRHGVGSAELAKAHERAYAAWGQP